MQTNLFSVVFELLTFIKPFCVFRHDNFLYSWAAETPVKYERDWKGIGSTPAKNITNEKNSGRSFRFPQGMIISAIYIYIFDDSKIQWLISNDGSQKQIVFNSLMTTNNGKLFDHHSLYQVWKIYSIYHYQMPIAPLYTKVIHGVHWDMSWWRHQMESFSALLAICAGNSPVPDEFPAQRPVRRSFDVFFDLRLNKRLSKQSWGLWFETLSHPLWRHCNVTRATQI